ncbi:Stem cell self-renewal protein Piwi [Lasallia pustulata]|uniref:Stem cell self-renewal protein Piwi n=1 Tax=Lasallia pustulata TaxID=136370 RepID=A0A1W5DEN8_9LECA|nr:Stem cell self-renewal protein Piwi [Lasallia pustulata]
MVVVVDAAVEVAAMMVAVADAAVEVAAMMVAVADAALEEVVEVVVVAPAEELLRQTSSEGLPPVAANVTQAENSLVAARGKLPLGKLSLSDKPQMPYRPGYGTLGSKVILRTNYFQVMLSDKDLQLFRYAVEVVPEPGPARKRKRAFELFIQNAPFLTGLRPAVATDNRATIITTQKLKLGSDDRASYIVPYYEADEEGPDAQRPVNLTFKIQYVKALSVQELLTYLSDTGGSARYDDKDELLQTLNIAMARKPSSSPDMAVLPGANKFFPMSQAASNLGGGLIALRGYYTSVRTSTLRLLVNVNSITAAFYREGPLLELMRQFRDDLGGRPLRLMNSFLKGVRVEVTHLRTNKGLPRKKVIFGIARRPEDGAGADRVSFRYEEAKRTVTVKEYFQLKYKINLTTAMAPLVNVGNDAHEIWVPPELCTVLPGQVAKKKLSTTQTENMVNVACRAPAENAQLIVGEGARVMGIGDSHTDGPTTFGLQIASKMLTVDGRVLSAPRLQYAGRSLDSRFGSWNMVGNKVFTGARISNWTFFEIQIQKSALKHTSLQTLMGEFQAMSQRTGLTMDNPTPPQGLTPLNLTTPPNYLSEIDSYFESLRTKTAAKILYIVIPAKNAQIYSYIKYLGDVKYGLTTVCSVAAKIEKDNNGSRSQYLANVALKWNLKRGGINQQLPQDKWGILKQKTMLVGIDVTHPSPGSQEGAPSIAGVVASIDDRYGQWPASVCCQESRKEMVSGLEDMMVERLRIYQRHNNQALPQNIIVYRDGVSEGQYQTVLIAESPAIDAAIRRVYPPKGAMAKVSIIIVGKRHHTRFYPTKPEEADQRSGNCVNGTVVDRGVTSERFWDFYLQAHTGIQGTARPAHYVVVQDRIRLGADALEQMTHNLCYLFGRATKAVSICPPAYYADLLCTRARCYLGEVLDGSDGASSSAGFNPATSRWSRGVHPALKDTMFYI